MRKLRLWMLAGMLLLAGSLWKAPDLPAEAPAEIPVESKYIALTFDDGPRRATTSRLLEGLRERGASATFFLIGRQIADTRDLVEQMKADGHQVGNHTWNHVRLTENSASSLSQEVGKTDQLLKQILGEDTYWLRPPYGEIAWTLRTKMEMPLVKWSIDPEDWDKKDAREIVQAVLEYAKPNGIILMHDIYEPSVDAALQVVDVLQAEGYTFVTVEELLALNGITPEPGGFYLSGNP